MKNPTKYRIRIIQDVARGYSQSRNTGGFQPSIPLAIARGLVASRMPFAIDLNCKARIAAEEIKNVGSTGVLSPELESARSLTQPAPKDHLGKTHLATKASSFRRYSGTRLWRDVLEHPLNPSTVLRTVPLPETSSGRIWNGV